MTTFLAWQLNAGTGLEFASAILGILGTCLMSRRYAPNLLRSMLYALAWPLLAVVGKGRLFRDFLAARASINWDVPDSAEDMALGLNLLFWAFFFQLLAIFVD